MPTPILDALKLPRVSVDPKGLDLVRATIAAALSDTPRDAAQFAANRWGAKSRAAEITKAAVSGATTTAATQGLAFVNDSAAVEFFDVVRSQAVIGKVPFRRIPFRTPTLSMDEGPAVAWRDENAAYRTSLLKVSRSAGLEPFDLGAMIVVTKELLQHSSVDAEVIVRDMLARGLAAELDRTLLDPANTGTSGIKPASITTGAFPDSSPAEAIFDWGDTFTGDTSKAWLVMNPWQAARLYGAARPDIGARGGTWAGFPVATSTAVADGIFILIDPDQVALALGGASVRATEQGAVEMQDSSSMTSGASPTAATLTSMWQTNSVAIIGSVAANWRVVRADAVQVFDAQAYGLSGGV